MILSSGIQHIFKFESPESIDIGSKSVGSPNENDTYSHLFLPELADEFNTNYVAVVSLISLFLPHFLKLDVSIPHSPIPLSKLLQCRANNNCPAGQGSSIVHCTHHLWSRHLPETKCSQLFCHQGRDAQLQSLAACPAGAHENPCRRDIATVSALVAHIPGADFDNLARLVESEIHDREYCCTKS